MRLLAFSLFALGACRHFDLDPELRNAARRYLYCPTGALTVDSPRAQSGQYEWAEYEVRGCGRVTWCGTLGSRQACQTPEDLDLALQQLSVESGCPRDQIAQVEYFPLTTQHTYRLAGCGQSYSCIVPMVSDEKGNEGAGSRFGSMLTCKTVAARPSVPVQNVDPLPPPPPPPPAP